MRASCIVVSQACLDTASRTIDQTGVRTRAIEKTLRDVESLPAGKSKRAVGLDMPSQQEVLLLGDDSERSGEDEGAEG